MHKNKTGLAGETLACAYLRENGCEIITTNYANRFGEIDLIGKDGEYIFFAEVKTRGENPLARPADAVDFRKQRKICCTAAAFLQTYKGDLQPRFDVIEVYLAQNGSLERLNHMKNAFDSCI